MTQFTKLKNRPISYTYTGTPNSKKQRVIFLTHKKRSDDKTIIKMQRKKTKQQQKSSCKTIETLTAVTGNIKVFVKSLINRDIIDLC